MYVLHLHWSVCILYLALSRIVTYSWKVRVLQVSRAQHAQEEANAAAAAAAAAAESLEQSFAGV